MAIRIVSSLFRSLIGLCVCVASVAEIVIAGEESVTNEQRVVTESLSEHVRSMMANLSPAARRGYEHLTQNVYLPSDFNQEVMDILVTQGHRPAWGEVADGDNLARTWEAFGLSPRPDDPTKPLQYVATDKGQFVMNCFACHGGSTYGVSFPGAPNSSYALESLTESVRRVKLQNKIALTHMDVGSMVMPLGTTVGTSNAVMFGVALMNFRDKDLNVIERAPAFMTHHDMDAPPWWHFSRKTHIYADGFAEKSSKGLMQFMLVRQNGPDKFKAWSKEFEEVYEFLASVEPPPYPLKIDERLAESGRMVFANHCADCHGTYGPQAHYPEVNVPIDEIGTDPVRWKALTPAHRDHYGQSWFADYGSQDTIADPAGYTAPPLDGIWSSAPYFHNGSVPTLWHVLNPSLRPQVWKRTESGFHSERVGFHVEELTTVPKDLPSHERRWYFDTKRRGKSAAGHDYPDRLSNDEKRELLEFLKTL
jgi:mono/diheme cytochrome c family protein